MKYRKKFCEEKSRIKNKKTLDTGGDDYAGGLPYAL